MEGEDQLGLYRVLADRLKQAHLRVANMDVTDDVRVQLNRRLLVVTAAAKHDLEGAARRLDVLMEELDDL